MKYLLETAIADRANDDEEISAYGVGYLADEFDFPHGVISKDLLDRASGAHDMVQNPIFPWMYDPGRPDQEVREQVLKSLERYGLRTTRDYVDFIEGSMAARRARLDGARI